MAEITKQALKVQNNTEFPNNNNGAITPSNLRGFNVNMIDSLVDEIGYNVDSASWNQQIDALEAFTASASGLTTGSLLVTASAAGNVITFTKGNNSTFNVTVATGSTVDISNLNQATASLQAYTASANIRFTNLESTTASLNSSVTQLNASSASQQISINALNQSSASQQVSIDNLNSNTGSYATTGSNIFVGANTFTSISASSFVSASEFIGNGSKITGITASIALPILDEGIPQGNAFSMNFTGSAISAIVVGGTAVVSVNVPDTGSFNALTASFNAFTASTNSSISQLNVATASLQTNSASVNTSITNVNSATASLFTSVNNINTTTASLNTATSSLFTSASLGLVTASAVGNTITFTKGNGTTFDVSVSSTPIDTGSFATTASFNAYTSSTNQRVSSLEVNSASVNTSISALNTFSASALVSISALNTFSASALVSISNLNTNSASVNTSITNINSATSSLFTSASLSLTTASVSGQLLSFTKGNNSVFSVTLPTGSQSIVTGSYGAFHDETTQSGSANTPHLVKFSNTDISDGVILSGSTGLKVGAYGTYNLQFSLQAKRISGTGTDTLDVWFRKNGIDIPWSNTSIGLDGGVEATRVVPAWNYMDTLNINDTLEIVWQSTDANVQLISEPASGSLPAIPSAIATLNRVDVGGGTNSVSTSSFNAYTSSNDSKVNSLIAGTGSYATTGSNTFNGTQTITGSVNISLDVNTAGYISSSMFQGPNANLTEATIGTLKAANGVVSGSSQITAFGFATTGSNTFVGNQTITGSVTISGSAANDLTVNGMVRVTGSGANNANITQNVIGLTRPDGSGTWQSLDFGGYLSAFTADLSEISLVADGASYTANWTNGPAISVNDPADSYPAMIGFQNKTNWTDGRVTILKPLDVSGSLSVSGSSTFRGNQTITGSLILSSSNATELQVIGDTQFTGSLIMSSSNAVELTVIGAAVFTGSVAGNVVSASITSNTASIDFSLGNYFEVTSSVTPLRLNVTNITPGRTSTLIISASASSSITFSSNVAQPSGSAYSGSLGSIDILSLVAFNSSRVNVVSTKALI